MSGKNPPVITSRNRRSTRRRGQEQDHVVAPGFGTKQDIEKLAKDLSSGSDAKLPAAAVEAMMNSRGRGILSPNPKDNANARPGATSSAWADFMTEAGIDIKFSANQGPVKASVAEENTDATKKKKGIPPKKSSRRKAYNLEFLAVQQGPLAKKKKISEEGVLLQTGTLDVTVVGRKGMSKDNPPYQLQVPTKILPGVAITKVFTSSNACHSIALDASGQAYGWGRNDAGQLTKDLPSNVATPTLLEGLTDRTIISAACGKSHTLVLTNDGQVLSVGYNKMGQCGIKSSTETVSQFKACIFAAAADIKIAQIACGEHFSVALSDQGQIYSTGSSEYGQLGNGETGEYFVTASKLAFANCNLFTLRNRFMEKDPAQDSSSSGKDKLMPIPEDIRIQHVACGKNHTVAVEADYDDEDDEPARLRVFSWGCGDYGVLGHGIQADEYFPREIATLGTSVWLPPGPLAVSAGAHCSLLKTSNGHVYYWGKHRSVGEAVMRPQLVEALANNRHVVTHADGGSQTVVCCTDNANTVAWGQGPHGELGLGTAKSSAKPQFVDALMGCRIQDLACGYGHTLFVVKDEDGEDKAAIAKLPELDAGAKDELETVWAKSSASSDKAGKKKG